MHALTLIKVSILRDEPKSINRILFFLLPLKKGFHKNGFAILVFYVDVSLYNILRKSVGSSAINIMKVGKHYVLRRALTRSGIGGCVEKRRSIQPELPPDFAPKGSPIKRCAVARFALFSGSV